MATATLILLPTIEEIQAFFFKGMLTGWVSDASPTPAPGMPGFFDFMHTSGKFRLVDRFCMHEVSHFTSGTTTIWHNDLPVWCMSYHGHYPSETLPFLKEVLQAAYKSQFFMGGRGIMTDKLGGFRYVNRPKLNDFTRFNGCEEVWNGSNERIGFHHYSGIQMA